MAFGWNATAYQTLNRGIEHWFSADGDAMAGYVSRAGVRVVAGAPVCAVERLPAVVDEFERDAARAGDRHVCYFGAGERLESVRRAPPHSPVATVLLGAQPVWHPSHLFQTIVGRCTLRAQLARARNKGLTIAEWPSTLDTPSRAALESVLHQWLATRGLPPLHFLVEPDTLDRLLDRRLFVATRDGAPVAFLVAAPVPNRQGWLVEQSVRGRSAPNGTSESLLAHAAGVLAADGAQYITLGLSPLSRRSPVPPPRVSPWLRMTLAWVRAHGRRFYNFDGLDAYKTKFRPESWEPIYALSNEPRTSPRTLYAIAAAFCAGSPVRTIARALGNAVAQETRASLRAIP
jgi:phosphatidylglycerol lysyltransferase